MLALYRDGSAGGSARGVERARGNLADELGIDRHRSSDRLQARVIAQSPDLDIPGGEPLRGYRLLERDGRGPASASSYRANQPNVGREVAVRVDARTS